MRVLLVSGIWPPQVGGPASHGPEFGRFLVEGGHDVRAATTADSAGPEGAGFPVRATRSDRPRAIRQPAAALNVLASGRRADVIYATGMYGRSALASVALRVPLVLKLVSDPAYERARRTGLFDGTLEEFQRATPAGATGTLKRLRNLVLKRARSVVIPSEYLARIARGWGLPAERVRVVPNPAPAVDATLPRDELRRRLGLTSPTFVFAGRLTPQKNLPLAIEAISTLESGSLVLVGDGPSRDELAALIAREGLTGRVSLEGALPRERAIEWLRAADAAILPSEWENFPHAAVEALAAGTPVIATAVGGVPEIVEPGVSGILVPPGDRAALAEAIGSLSENGARLAALREGALAAGARFERQAVYGAIAAELELAAGR